jgi:RimJ/RimL family protein N-acetyltransferase
LIPVSARADTRLVEATPDHFAWAARAAPDERLEGLRLAPGGIEAPEVLSWIARTAATVSSSTGTASAWLVVDGDEAVGLISLKSPPREGVVEIGYGIAESRRGRGHASAAVGLVLAIARSRRWTLTAETSPTNPASAKVLERNGFERVGERVDDDEGPLHSWRAARA